MSSTLEIDSDNFEIGFLSIFVLDYLGILATGDLHPEDIGCSHIRQSTEQIIWNYWFASKGWCSMSTRMIRMNIPQGLLLGS